MPLKVISVPRLVSHSVEQKNIPAVPMHDQDKLPQSCLACVRKWWIGENIPKILREVVLPEAPSERVKEHIALLYSCMFSFICCVTTDKNSPLIILVSLSDVKSVSPSEWSSEMSTPEWSEKKRKTPFLNWREPQIFVIHILVIKGATTCKALPKTAFSFSASSSTTPFLTANCKQPIKTTIYHTETKQQNSSILMLD